jgi:leucine dehydrogenase
LVLTYQEKKVLVQGNHSCWWNIIDYSTKEGAIVTIGLISTVEKAKSKMISKYKARYTGSDLYTVDVDIYAPQYVEQRWIMILYIKLKLAVIAGAANNQWTQWQYYKKEEFYMLPDFH